MKKVNCIVIVYIILALSLGILIGNHLHNNKHSHQYGSRHEEAKEIRSNQGKLTNPLLECEIGEDTVASMKLDFTPQLIDFVEKLKRQRDLSDISIYFRDLNNGPIVGYNQDNNFYPASLLKVPILIAYLALSEDNSRILDEMVTLKVHTNENDTQVFAPEVNLEVGVPYSVRDLLERMIKYSDNKATTLLLEKLPVKYQKDFYQLIGVDPNIIYNPDFNLTVRQYSIFFRILFNSSFLSLRNSEYALSLLSKTTFKDGLRAGVPNEITIAHKFGERKVTESIIQFHDCGIVYYPLHPYLLCIMTKGEKIENLVESISEVSKFVYSIIDKQYK